MGGVGNLMQTVADGIAGLIGGAVTALAAGFWAVVGQLQAWLPGPLFPLVVGGVFVGLLIWAVRK